MSTPLAEQPYSSNNPERHLHLVPDLPEDEVLAGLQAYLHSTMGEKAPRIEAYEVKLWKVYKGNARDKEQVDGWMKVYMDTGGEERSEIEVNQHSRPFSSELCTALGRIAEANFRQGNGYIRDLCY